MATIVYFLNRSPKQAIAHGTPYQAWSGRRSNVSHFLIFRSIAYACVPSKLRKKLDEKSEKCIFIGYSEATKKYKPFNFITNKLIISRDVKFNEDEA